VAWDESGGVIGVEVKNLRDLIDVVLDLVDPPDESPVYQAVAAMLKAIL